MAKDRHQLLGLRLRVFWHTGLTPMAIPKVINAQRDFSAGELDESVKRADELGAMKAGAREMLNWRILSSKSLSNRPGRTALFSLEGAVSGRIEEFVMRGTLFYLGFASGGLGVFAADGVFLGSITSFSFNGVTYPLPWTAATMNRIVWAQTGDFIYIAYADGMPNNVPLVLNYDGTIFGINAYMETVDGAQKRTLFYRLSSPGITLQPSTTTGNISIKFS